MGKLIIRTSAQLHAIAVNLISRKKPDPNRFIYTQGCGVFGSLGQGDDLADSPSFKKLNLSGSNADDIDVKDISAGWGHTAVATVDGNLVVFGRPYDDLTIKTVNRIKGYSASFGRYYGKFSSSYGGPDEVSYGNPQFVDGVNDVCSVHCSIALTVALTKSGEIFTFGQNKWGQCGIDDKTKGHVYYPQKVPLEHEIKKIDVGLNHCVAFSKCGLHVYTWGRGTEGQLGVGFYKSRPDPLVISQFKGLIVDVSAGFNHSAAITSEGLLYVWGKGMATVLKNSSTKGSAAQHFDNQSTPREIRITGGRHAVEISSGNNTLVIRCSDDSLWAMGVGEYDRTAVCVPVRVQQGILKGSICNSPDLKIKGGDGFYNIDTSDPSRSKNEKKKNSVEDPSRDVLNSSLDSHFLKDLLSRSGSEIKERTPHVLTPTLENPLTYPPVVLPLDAVLMKGFQRACILCPSTEGLLMSNRTSSPINDDNKDGNDTHELKGNKIDTSSPADSYSNLQVFEIVIHAGESFLKQKDIDISIDPSDTNKKRSNKIVNFSTGWQHSILVLENKK